MGAAAELMSNPPQLPGAPALDPARDPRIKPHERLAAASAASEISDTARVHEIGSVGRESEHSGNGKGSDVSEGAMMGSKTRVWGVRSLAKQSAAPKRTFRNRFV